MERILIVRLGAMGDVVHALPAVAFVRRTLPQAAIDWAIEGTWQDLISPELARPVVVDTKRWRQRWYSPATWREATAMRRQLRSSAYSLVLDLQGAIKSAVVADWTKSPKRFGFLHPREPIATRFYTDKLHPRGKHVIEQNLELAQKALNTTAAANSERHPIAALLPSDPEAERWATSLCPHNFALLNPGAGWKAKEWPAERYGQLAKHLSNMGLHSLVNLGPSSYEQSLAEIVEATSGGIVQRVECSIRQLVALTRRASLSVGGDTGPMHLANALGIPVVAIFGPTNERATHPIGDYDLMSHPVFCRPCMLRDCPIDHRCMKRITVDAVYGALARRLEAAR